MVERGPEKAGVGSSILLLGIFLRGIYSFRFINFHIFADVAQLVEQDFRKVKVGGSIPLIGF